MGKIKAIIAVDSEFGIAKDGTIPWHIPDEMKHFKDTTMGHHVLMGSNTYFSISEKYRPLVGRKNYVLTTNIHTYEEIERLSKEINKSDSTKIYAQLNPSPGSYTAADIAQIINSMLTDDDLYIIGGKSIYEQTAAITDELILSRIPKSYDCDLKLNPSTWNHLSLESVQSSHEEFYIETYIRH